MFEEHEVWSVGKSTEFTWDIGQQVSDETLTESVGKSEFVRIVGECESTDMKEVSSLVKKLWSNSPNLFAIKLDVKIKGIEGATDVKHMDIESLPSIISKELKGRPEGELWDELSGGEV